ncbi:MAG TPA: metal ABC transporter permease [Longimicrobium sp.]|nr:metal ABC transporter permease [Longimicrobium sp.]
MTFDYTLRVVALGAAALGATSGALGSFAVLRKQSLLGDAISHAALPGIALAFLLTGSKATPVLMIGAAIAGWMGTLAVMRITQTTRIKEDSALGVVLAVFFGFGLVLLTYVQKQPDASQAGLDRFLFGQAATLLYRDVVLIAGVGAAALLGVYVFWKEFKLLAFDPDYGASLGFPMRTIDVILTTLLVISIVIGLQTVGVVLMSAMVVAPAAAARQWTDRTGTMVAVAGVFGALAGVSGAVFSSLTEHLPTGPTIVLCLTAIVLVSLALAPNRGLAWEALRARRNRRSIRGDAVLRDLRELAGHHATLDHGHPVAVLEAMRSGAHNALGELEARGWARQTAARYWAITPEGVAEADRRAAERGEDDS